MPKTRRRKVKPTIFLLFLCIPVFMIVMVGIQLHSIEYLSMHGYFESVEHYLRVSPGNPHHPTNTSKQDDSDREPILEILRQGGYDLDDKTTFHDGVIASLPKWSEVTSFYGPPRVIGLETCKAFRDKVPLDKRMIGAAGIFNSGTNFLFYLLKKNCWNPKKKGSGMLWQVPWGKHRPESSRGNHVAKKSEKKEDVLPVVAIRDPYTWMQSMCRQPYGAQFDHNKDSCPNIIPYPEDIASHPRHGKVDYMPVWITYSKELKVKHLSLAHLWNEWYYPYMWNVSYPRLMVRLEDLLFHADTVLPQICECMGGRYHQEVKHHAEVANRNRGIDTNETSQGLLRSIIKYGNIQNRRKGYPSNQLQAAKEILDPKAMELFGYRYETPDIYPPIRLTQIGNSRK